LRLDGGFDEYAYRVCISAALKDLVVVIVPSLAARLEYIKKSMGN